MIDFVLIPNHPTQFLRDRRLRSSHLRFAASLSLTDSTNICRPANSPHLHRNVPPVFPDGPPHPEALSLTAGSILPNHRPFCPADPSQEPVCLAVQHATGTEGWDYGDVGDIQLAAGQEEACQHKPVLLQISAELGPQRQTAPERACERRGVMR